MIYIEIVFNLSLLVALSVVSGFIEHRHPRQTRSGMLLQGMLFGAVAVIGMLHPLIIKPGLIFDGRSVMLSLCSLFFGPLTAGIAGAMAIAYRISLGGVGTSMGVLVILSSIAIGLAARKYLEPETDPPSTRNLYIFGVAVHVAMLAMAFSMPLDTALSTLRLIGVPVILFYPLATILAGKILSDQINYSHYISNIEKAREHISVTLHSIGDAVISTDIEGRVSIMNPVAEALTGWYNREAKGRFLDEVFTIVDSKTGVKIANPVKKVLDHGKVIEFTNQTVLIAKNGNKFQISDSASPIRSEDGGIIGVVLVFRDVTEYYKAQEERLKNERLFRIAGRMARIGGWSVDLSQNVVTWTDEVASIHEMPPDITPGLDDALNFYTPEFQQKLRTLFENCARGGIPYDEEMQIITARGNRIWVRTIAEAVRDESGEIVSVQGALQDLSERKRTEKKIQQQDILLHEMASIAKIGAWEFDPATGKGTWTDEAAKIHGLDPDEETNMNKGISYFHGKYRKMIENAIMDAIDHARPYNLELEIITATGGRKWVRTIGHPRVKNGKTVSVKGTIQDITQHKLAATALEESERNYRKLFEDHAAIKLIIDPETGEITDANHAAESYYGWSREELMDMKIQQINILTPQQIQQQMANASAKHQIHFEFKHRRKDGSVRDVEVFSSRINLKGKDYLHSIVHDITERKNLEAQLEQVQKLESIGRLAGGVAHDFNNMLSIIIGNADLAMDLASPGTPIIDHLEEIRKAGTRSSKLTRQLLAFARKQTIAPVVMDLNETIEGMLRMLRRLIGEDISLYWHPTRNIGRVKMDPTQVDQVLVNLVVNARDAIEGVGRLMIETGNRLFDEAYCRDHPECVPGHYAVLGVSDNGCGMDKETIEHIFEPFFTKKPKGSGTGLGLSTVYGIIRQNNGFINVYSEPGKGSTFRIYIPRMEGDAIEYQNDEKRKPPIGSETILLVEDEPELLKIAKQMLEQLGYNVLEAGTPGDAIRCAEKHSGKVDLLITDVVMPEMNGLELYNRLKSMQIPKCLYISGYTADVITHHGILDEAHHFIQKPFSTKEIAVKVREVLDGKPV